MVRRIPDSRPAVDLRVARSVVSAFSGACGLDCYLVSPDGEAIASSSGQEGCSCCRAQPGRGSDCDKIRLYGAYQAERFGGRYIYYCPHGFAWCACPVLIGGQVAASLSCGPALIMEVEDYLAAQTDQPDQLTWEGPVEILERIPYKPPAVLGDISILLATAAAYLGERSHLLDSQRSQAEQQQQIGDTLQALNTVQGAPSYPMEKEKALIRTIREGNQAEARRLLNELLGHIIFYTGGSFPLMRSRSLELMCVLSRAAVEGGGDLEQVLALNHQFLCESACLKSAEDLTVWLTHVIERYANLVFDLVDIKHKDLIYRALNYIKLHYAEPITLEAVAKHTGFSPTYFSKIFKEELSCTFNHYLNQVRIEQSKGLLLKEKLTISDICYMVGFEDQSYFIKVFRRHVGVTPGQYRRRQGRLDPSKERDGCSAHPAGHRSAG